MTWKRCSPKTTTVFCVFSYRSQRGLPVKMSPYQSTENMFKTFTFPCTCAPASSGVWWRKIRKVGLICFKRRQHPYLCKGQIGQESHIVHVCAVMSRPVLHCQDTHTHTQNSPNQFLQTLHPSFPFHWLDATPQQPSPDYYRNPFKNLKVALQKLHKTPHPIMRK